ncbi:MAG: hypothetical protein M5U16_02325 [Hyphomicrobium sp.]|nr:hypothetical protein [Hyphomicrobium sp.]
MRQRRRIVLDEGGALDRQHDVRLPGERLVDVCGGERELQVLIGDVLFDAGKIVFEPGDGLAAPRLSLLLDAFARDA